jgi:hypothetical protein
MCQHINPIKHAEAVIQSVTKKIMASFQSFSVVINVTVAIMFEQQQHFGSMTACLNDVGCRPVVMLSKTGNPTT